MKSLYQYDNYQSYLEDVAKAKDAGKRGFRSQLAEKLGCQRTFVSQVLSGVAHFNLEHGAAISEFLGHSTEEADYFLLLIIFARAGTPLLRARLKAQIMTHQENHLILKNRFRERESLLAADKVEYYSSWLYGAIRVLVTIPKYQSRTQILKYFNLPPDQIERAIEFLLSRKLVTEKGGRIQANEKHMYLGNDSKLIVRHHTNWRLQALRSLDCERKSDLHFSAVNSLSREDVLKIREELALTIEKIRQTVKESPEECLYSLCVDFFEAN